MPIILKNNKIIFNQNSINFLDCLIRISKITLILKSSNNKYHPSNPTITFFYLFQINNIIRHLKANLNISTTKFILFEKKTIKFTVTSLFFAGRENLQPFYYSF